MIDWFGCSHRNFGFMSPFNKNEEEKCIVAKWKILTCQFTFPLVSSKNKRITCNAQTPFWVNFWFSNTHCSNLKYKALFFPENPFRSIENIDPKTHTRTPTQNQAQVIRVLKLKGQIKSTTYWYLYILYSTLATKKKKKKNSTISIR